MLSKHDFCKHSTSRCESSSPFKALGVKALAGGEKNVWAVETSTRSQQVLSLPDDDDERPKRRCRAKEHFSLSPPKTLSRVTHCTSNVLLLKIVVQGTNRVWGEWTGSIFASCFAQCSGRFLESLLWLGKNNKKEKILQSYGHPRSIVILPLLTWPLHPQECANDVQKGYFFPFFLSFVTENVEQENILSSQHVPIPVPNPIRGA